VRNPTLKYKTQLVDRKKSVKCTNSLYQDKCINYAQHNLSQQPITSTCLIISSSKYDLLTKINHQVNSQPYAQYHQVNQQDTSIAIHHTLHKPNTINPYTRPCAKTISLIHQEPITYHATIGTIPICKSDVVTELPTFCSCQICCRGFVVVILLPWF
jgi:hypothetical protein